MPIHFQIKEGEFERKTRHNSGPGLCRTTLQGGRDCYHSVACKLTALNTGNIQIQELKPVCDTVFCWFCPRMSAHIPFFFVFPEIFGYWQWGK